MIEQYRSRTLEMDSCRSSIDRKTSICTPGGTSAATRDFFVNQLRDCPACCCRSGVHGSQNRRSFRCRYRRKTVSFVGRLGECHRCEWESRRRNFLTTIAQSLLAWRTWPLTAQYQLMFMAPAAGRNDQVGFRMRPDYRHSDPRCVQPRGSGVTWKLRTRPPETRRTATPSSRLMRCFRS